MTHGCLKLLMTSVTRKVCFGLTAVETNKKKNSLFVFWQWQTCEHELESSEYSREGFGVTVSAFLSSQLLWVAERSRTLSGCRCIVTTCYFISQTRLISPPGPKAAGGWPHPRTEARGGHLLDRSIAPYPPPVATLLAPPDRLTSDLRRTPQTNTHTERHKPELISKAKCVS